VTAGALPKGITLHPATGILAGTLEEEGDNSFTITVTDAAGKTDARPFSLKVKKFAITTDSMPPGLPGKAYHLKVVAGGGRNPYTKWKVTPQLPARLSLNGKTGEITGKPVAATAAQDYTFEVTDRTGKIATKTVNFEVKTSIISTETLPFGAPGEDYNQTLAATGSSPFTAWAIVGGDLPAGMACSAAGVLPGKPLGAVEATLTFQCTDSGGVVIQKVLDLTIKTPVKISTNELP
jgi:large repetitive protein